MTPDPAKDTPMPNDPPAPPRRLSPERLEEIRGQCLNALKQVDSGVGKWLYRMASELLDHIDAIEHERDVPETEKHYRPASFAAFMDIMRMNLTGDDADRVENMVGYWHREAYRLAEEVRALREQLKEKRETP